MIPMSECKHGWLYKIDSRNLILGVYNETQQGFVGIREKFGNEYLFTNIIGILVPHLEQFALKKHWNSVRFRI